MIVRQSTRPSAAPPNLGVLISVSSARPTPPAAPRPHGVLLPRRDADGSSRLLSARVDGVGKTAQFEAEGWNSRDIFSAAGCVGAARSAWVSRRRKRDFFYN
jgi:hypothetical protein